MKQLVFTIVLLFSINIISAQKYTTQYINNANKLGLDWWGKINNGEYELSYNALSSELKRRYSKESWLHQISLLMEEFGELETRIVHDTYFQSELEGFGNGFYVIVEYNVKYSKTINHTENLILKQNDQLQWVIFDFNYEFQNLDTEKEIE